MCSELICARKHMGDLPGGATKFWLGVPSSRTGASRFILSIGQSESPGSIPVGESIALDFCPDDCPRQSMTKRLVGLCGSGSICSKIHG
jgi:hypothetical protein